MPGPEHDWRDSALDHIYAESHNPLEDQVGNAALGGAAAAGVIYLEAPGREVLAAMERAPAKEALAAGQDAAKAYDFVEHTGIGSYVFGGLGATLDYSGYAAGHFAHEAQSQLIPSSAAVDQRTVLPVGTTVPSQHVPDAFAATAGPSHVSHIDVSGPANSQATHSVADHGNGQHDAGSGNVTGSGGL